MEALGCIVINARVLQVYLSGRDDVDALPIRYCLLRPDMDYPSFSPGD